MGISRYLRTFFLSTAVMGMASPTWAAGHWIVARTPHFEMYSDESEAESRRILVGLEVFRANVLHILPLARGSEPRATVVVFARDSAFRAYRPLYQGKPKAVSGYFLPNDDQVMIAMTTDVPDTQMDPRRVIYHEYTHLLVNARDAHYPLWLNEGLAEVLSTFHLTNGKVEYGEPIDNHVALLRQSTLLPLPRLFAVTKESPEYNEESRMGIFYAESWALTHYLLFGQDKSNGEKLSRFIGDLSLGADVAVAFGDAFGSGFSAVQYRLEEYLRSGAYYKRQTPTVAQDFPVTFRAAPDVEKDAALLDLRWRVRHNADAGHEAFELLKRDPHQARPHELLAAVAADEGDSEAAQDHWKQAAEQGSENAWVYLQLLREALSGYHGEAVLNARLDDEVVAPWRAWAARACQLSPDNREAVESALVVEALAGKMNIRTINAGQQQLMGMHDRARGLLALAIVHWRANQIASARALLHVVDSERRADMETRAAADALRYRLPGDAQPALPAGAYKIDEKNAAIALLSGRQGEAGKFLDRLLEERGTTAPRLKLEPLIARFPAAPQDDPWQRADALQEKANGGDAEAMFELAVAHARAAGVEFSPALAEEWLSKAAEHGFAPAKAGLPPTGASADADQVVRFLREQKLAWVVADVPPLDRDLQARIAEVAGAADRRPPEAVYRASPRFPSTFHASGGKGEVLVRFTIGADGHTDHVQATAFTDPACAAAAEQCLRAWRFLPTIRDGRPAATLAEITVVFGSKGELGKAAEGQTRISGPES